MSHLDGKVAVVTGAGAGLGREHALALAAAGATVVVNDMNADAAQSTLDDITEAGGAGSTFVCSVSDWTAAGEMVQHAIDTHGDIDILINNAGITRDAMSFSMTEEQFDQVVDVHLKGHFAPSHHVAAYWRNQAKAGIERPRRIINTASESGIFGGPAQGNYASAKGGILSMTLTLGRELNKYGVTVNCIAPRARTGITEHQGWSAAPDDPNEFDRFHPGNASPLVVYLCTDAASEVCGQTFIIGSNVVVRMRRYTAVKETRTEGRWTVDGLIDRADEIFEGWDRGQPSFDQPKF
ncbi:MAG: SDR family NAD(P)-dependent oxidoreductase [Acidimicrobiales bacterium]|nr:SDR family NAD(P)-dependent oxidoreductase [Acidimicrobiales bacterium]